MCSGKLPWPNRAYHTIYCTVEGTAANHSPSISVQNLYRMRRKSSEEYLAYETSQQDAQDEVDVESPGEVDDQERIDH